MATEYISREFALHNIECGQWDTEKDKNRAIHYVRELTPAADVRPVAEISNAVDEVLDFLNDNSNCMPYHIYSALYDLISGICPKCGADMREGTK